MASPFEVATKEAIREIIEKYTIPSKFGHFISSEGNDGLIDGLYDFFRLSRELKGRGDQFLNLGTDKSHLSNK